MRVRASRAIGRRAIAAASVPLSVLVVLLVAVPATAAKPGKVTERGIFEQLGVDRERADYVVLIDTSGSMADRGLYDRVRRTLRPFLAGPTKADHVALYTFDTTIRPRYVGRGGRPHAILARLPRKPSNGDTDIGGAVSTALDELSRPRAAQVGAIVMLTDGKNDPLPGSPFEDTKGSAWAALRARAARLAAAGRTIRGYSLPLRRDATGAKLLRQVVPESTIVDPAGVPDIRGFLDRTKQGFRIEKAKRKLAGDIGQGVEVEWPAHTKIDLDARSAAFPVVLHSELKRAPVTVTQLALDTSASEPGLAELDARTPDQIELAPGQRKTVVIKLRWKPEAGSVPYKRTKTLEPSLTLTGRVTSPWAAALAPDLDLRVDPEPRQATRMLRLETTVGSGWVLPLIALAVVLLLIVLCVLTYMRRRPKLRGVLQMQTVRDDDIRSVAFGRRSSSFAFDSNERGPAGRGTVRPARLTGGSAGLAITYSPDGSRGRQSAGTLRVPDGTLTLGGVRFTFAGGDGSGPTNVVGDGAAVVEHR